MIDEYGIFYLIDHPAVGIIAVIQSAGMQFTLADWQGEQPMTVDEIRGQRWVDGRGEEAIMYKGLPRILVGGEFGRR